MAYTRTLEELLAGVRRGDRQALTELHGRFAPSLMGMLLRSLGDRSAAEAVIAEASSIYGSEPGTRMGSVAA
jgi:hypothetical protein